MEIIVADNKDMPKDSAQRSQDSPARHSPAPPLAPLEYLQNQRRGSITDPSLHAAGPNNQSAMSANSTSPTSLFRSQEQSHGQANPKDSQNAPPQQTEHTTSQAKSLSSERGNGVNTSKQHNGQIDTAKADEHVANSQQRPPTEVATSKGQEDHANFNYGLRRHSLTGSDSGRQARGSPVSPSHTGSKRKMSSERGTLPAVGEEIDPQLVGPGSHSNMSVDPEEPAPKRRTSAFDARGMAQLSLNDRRESDARTNGSGTSPWYDNRRDSTSSMFSATSMNSSVGFNSPAFSGDSHGRQPGSMTAFAWPPNAGPNDPPGGHEQADPSLTRQEGGIPFHMSAPPGPATTMPVDRRMSVPDTMPSSSTTRPERVLRSRSRPPSRTTAAIRANENAAVLPDTPTSNKAEESPTSASSSGPAAHAKEPGSTPYSRSPELRISHKLAERKRRKEMRDLFDELRDQLPADRGMKASKWEILSKAIDFISQMKQSHQEMAREIEMLRHELDSVRHGVAFGHPPPGAHPMVYAHGPPPVPAPYPPPGAHPQQPNSRPGSSHNSFGPGPGQPVVSNGKA